uniref:Ring finger protein n=1 Tax=Solanum tuberosum TaxID=4113 RepID=M1AET3_SOLTU
MPISLYLLLCLPFVVMALLFFFYLYVVFSRGRDDYHSRVVIKTARKQGLSDVQLKKLPKIVGKDLSLDINDCAICKVSSWLQTWIPPRMCRSLVVQTAILSCL